ncbi:MAG: amidohydrolase [Candidatus Zixiibacteriota bacterium]|nr:MAG: amidohydrolase [candidate division Zixibacteria bacterium]
MRLFISFLISIVSVAAMVSSAGADSADLALVNGKIVTVAADRPQAQAVAITGDLITAVGNDEEIRSRIGPNTRVIDLHGKLAIPGFIEGHAHFVSLGMSLMRLDLKQAGSWDEIVSLVESEVARREPGVWIIGRGWHQDKWEAVPQPNVDGLPLHDLLSRVSPDNPVILGHASGHSCIANARAMAAADISAESVDPEGGRIVRDDSGEPIGVFLETAMDLVYRARDSLTANRTYEEAAGEERRAIALASQECLSNGITSFQDAGSSFETIDLLRSLAADGALDLRLWVMISEDNERLAEKLADYRITGEGRNHLTVRAIKRLIDGALGSHGAWLLEPYLDLPSNTGLNTESLETMRETARLAIENGFQLCTHAIGDRGNHETLNIYESAFADHPDKADLRWRIEHAQHLHPDDIPRFGQLGVIASMQGIHCTSDAPWVPKRLGDKRSAEGAYVWRDQLQSGAILSNGTDAPVEDVDPLANFYALVTRKTSDGVAFYPEQCLTREEALRAYTINCAFAAFEEHLKGSITVGKLADITVLSKDIMTIPEDEIPAAEILYTIVGGEIKYQAE